MRPQLPGRTDFSGAKERLISLLTEKYGLRQHNPKNLLGDDEYIFGSEDHAACLQVREEKSFTLEYFDKSLRDIAYAEIEARQAQEEAEKKAVLKKGL